MDQNNKYTKMQKAFYDKDKAKQMAETNHEHHNLNTDYWSCLLRAIKDDPDKWDNKTALDFGCGTGRNIINLWSLACWGRMDGVDISKYNLIEASKILKESGIPPQRFNLYQNNGIDLQELKSNEYDFVMSTIALQHIAVYEIRYNLLSEMFRTMKKGGVLSIQMGYGRGYGKAEYYENAYDAKGTNTKHDVIVPTAKCIYSDLIKIGFKDTTHQIMPPFSDGHPKWIYVQAVKPY